MSIQALNQIAKDLSVPGAAGLRYAAGMNRLAPLSLHVMMVLAVACPAAPARGCNSTPRLAASRASAVNSAFR